MLPYALDGVDLGDDLLEIGAGPGRTTDLLRDRVARLTAVELDDDLAAQLTDAPAGTNVEVVHADATEMPLPADRFSAAVVVHDAAPRADGGAAGPDLRRARTRGRAGRHRRVLRQRVQRRARRLPRRRHVQPGRPRARSRRGSSRPDSTDVTVDANDERFVARSAAGRRAGARSSRRQAASVSRRPCSRPRRGPRRARGRSRWPAPTW